MHLPKGFSSEEASDAGVASLEHIVMLIESVAYGPGATATTMEQALAEIDGERGKALFARMARNRHDPAGRSAGPWSWVPA